MPERVTQSRALSSGVAQRAVKHGGVGWHIRKMNCGIYLGRCSRVLGAYQVQDSTIFAQQIMAGYYQIRWTNQEHRVGDKGGQDRRESVDLGG